MGVLIGKRVFMVGRMKGTQSAALSLVPNLLSQKARGVVVRCLKHGQACGVSFTNHSVHRAVRIARQTIKEPSIFCGECGG